MLLTAQARVWPSVASEQTQDPLSGTQRMTPSPMSSQALPVAQLAASVPQGLTQTDWLSRMMQLPP